MNSQKPGRAVTFRFAPIRTIPGGFAGGARVPTLYVTKISFRVIVCLLEPEVRNPMNESKGRPLQPQILSYDEDYFHGRTSGYASEGYKNCHPDWSAWLDVLQSLVTSGIFLDCGCAYGYLVDEARRRGYQAFGIDISEFALRQEPGFRPWLAQADASRLPFKDSVADVVALFDVLEHLESPVACLEEVRRVLKPGGLVVGATPDPIFFTGDEPSHISERPPAFWVAVLRDLGFAVRFRFSNLPYNFQFLAAPANRPVASRLAILQHDYFDENRRDIVEVNETTPNLHAVLRSGWSPLVDGVRKISSYPSSMYILNDGCLSLRATIHVALRHTPCFSTLRVRFDSYVLAELFLNSEQCHITIEAKDVLIPAGGHNLFFELFPGGPEVTVESVRISATPGDSETLVEGLPFDLFQRYKLSSDIVRLLAPETVLDVGGYLGDENGHLAVSHDFLQQKGSSSPRVTVTDVRQCDHPDYRKAFASRQPFDDSSFDLVMSLDVLEHLQAPERTAFLEELMRVSRQWILLGAPFLSPEVEKAERELSQSVMAARHFLQEHQQLGLPELFAVRDFFLSHGCSVMIFPNGYLPSWLYWQVMTQHYFGWNDYQVTRKYNSLYSRTVYSTDNREPAYRHILLIGKSPTEPEKRNQLERLISRETGVARHPLDHLAFQPAFLDLHQRVVELAQKRQTALTDTQFLINARQDLIQILQRSLDDIEKAPLWRLVARRVKKRLKRKAVDPR